MSDKAQQPTVQETAPATETAPTAADKGKGKSVEQTEPESDSEVDDSKVEENEEEDDESDDDMQEIDTSNIIESGRTRGRRVDYTKPIEGVPDEDEEDDEDFVAQEEQA